jgi:hypothetical protein
VAEGFSERYGARPLRRAVQRWVEDTLAECMLNGFVGAGQSVELDVDGSQHVKVRNTERGSMEHTLRARWVAPRASWVTLRARWVTLRASWVTLTARWVMLRARWVTLRARWVTLRAHWVPLRARWVTFR